MSETSKEETIESKVDENETADNEEHDPHYDPIISLPEVSVPTLEEDETVMISLRAKLYRYDGNESPPEWKERGTGNVKMLHHKMNDTVRVVMRRDKTLKLCANHFISTQMVLQPSTSSNRVWVYSAIDFSDAKVKPELLAIKFANVENAQKWKETFEEAQKILASCENSKNNTAVPDDKIIVGDAPILSDTFEEDKKNSFSDKKEDNESASPKKLPTPELTEKISTLTIKSS